MFLSRIATESPPRINLEYFEIFWSSGGIAGAATNEGRCHRACQQDCADGLGHDGQGRALQGTRRTRGVNEIAPDIRRDVKVGRANST